MNKGITTIYHSTVFRSRLEARWAAMFDRLGWDWVYEPVDADGYIPDFLIQGEHPLFAEVGPCVSLSDYEAKARKPGRCANELKRDFLILGASPALILDRSQELQAGWLGEYGCHGEYGGAGQPLYSLAWGPAVWYRCAKCSAIGVSHAFQLFTIRPCGHDGDGRGPVSRDELHALWAWAGNATQWHPDAQPKKHRPAPRPRTPRAPRKPR